MAKSGWDWNLFRLAVIEAGIRGELTADWRAANPDVEPAHMLLERIAEEKAELIRTKQIRKEKPLPPINPDEIPFDIPANWDWCRLIQVCVRTGSGATPRGGKSAYVSAGVPFLRSQNVLNACLDISDVAHITEETHASMSNTEVHPNDVLLNITGGSIGRSCVVPKSFVRGNVNQHVSIIRACGEMSPEYLSSLFLSPFYQAFIETAQTGAGREGLPKGKMDLGVIPIPPESEQQEIVRILSALDSGEFDGPVHPVVARIQKLEKEFRALAGEYESQEKWLSDLRSALLQEAISGQLTADWRAANPDVEPAHMLLERIAEEKAELIRTKQIRKEKPIPPIHPDEIPYDIPESWEWTRVGEMSQIIAGFSFKKPQYQDQGLRIIRISDFDQKGFTDDSVVRYKYSEDLERYRIKNGDILMPMTGSIGKNHRVSELPEDDCFLNQRIAIVRTNHFSSEFLDAVLSSSTTIEAHRACMKSTNGNISLGDVRGTLIPLPCSQEQQEIVRRLEMQLEKLDTLQLELEQSKEAGQLLMKSKLAEVFDLDSQD